MSLVVAYKKGDVVYMGADTQVTCGSEIGRTLNEIGFKIARMPSGILMGVCGRVKYHQRILAQKQWFTLGEGEKLSKRYIVKNVIPALSALMQNISEDKDASHSSMEISLLLAQEDRLFLLTRQFAVYECDHCLAIGAGDDYAKFALMQAGQAADINEGLIRALKTGAHFDSTVSAPYILIDTKNREYQIVEDEQ